MTSAIDVPEQGRMPVTRPSSSVFGECPLIPAAAGWVCGKEAGHQPPCGPPPSQAVPSAAATAPPSPGPVAAAPSPSVPTPAPAAAPAAPQQGGYFVVTATAEEDLLLPSGSKVRYRKIRDGSELELDLIELVDGFTPELLQAAQIGDATEVARAVAKPDTRKAVFGPVDRVVVAAVIAPRLVLDGPTTAEQVNVKDMDLLDRMTIFNAAFGEQLAKLKSVLAEQETVL